MAVRSDPVSEQRPRPNERVTVDGATFTVRSFEHFERFFVTIRPSDWKTRRLTVEEAFDVASVNARRAKASS